MTRELLEKVKAGKISIEDAQLIAAGGDGRPKLVPPGTSKKTGRPYKARIEFPADCYPNSASVVLLRCIVSHVLTDGGKAVLALCDECDQLNKGR